MLGWKKKKKKRYFFVQLIECESARLLNGYFVLCQISLPLHSQPQTAAARGALVIQASGFYNLVVSTQSFISLAYEWV